MSYRQCVNHVMYADDICLMAPSLDVLQKLIYICYDISMQSNLLFNSFKFFVWYLNLDCKNNRVHLYTGALRNLSIRITLNTYDSHLAPTRRMTMIC